MGTYLDIFGLINGSLHTAAFLMHSSPSFPGPLLYDQVSYGNVQKHGFGFAEKMVAPNEQPKAGAPPYPQHLHLWANR